MLMPGLNSSEKARFEKFLSTLPKDRKKALYERFRSMDAEERNVAIRKILANTAKTSGKSAPGPQAKQAAPAKAPKGAPDKHQQKPKQKAAVQQTGKKTAQPVKPEKKQSSVKPGEEKKTDKNKAKEVKRPNFNRIVNVLTVMVVLGCLFTLSLAYLTNMSEINSLFMSPAVSGKPGNTPSPSGSASETEASDKETSASTTSETTAEPTATPTPLPLKSDAPDLDGITVVIDPMHQAETSTATEDLLPDKTAFKAAATKGGEGVKTGVKESELVLDYALAAKEYLEKCGAKVVLTRTTDDIDLSNQDRARMATSSDCDVFIRLEARSVDDAALTGVRVCIPEYGKNKTKDLKTGEMLSKMIAEAENMEDGGVLSTIAYTGLNYATSVHAFQLNLGFLSNENDETILADSGNIYEVAASLAEFCNAIKK
jgi:N-acetylmuramoyl-L-alanine amidase